METFDLIVIGSGPGGYAAAIRAAKLGMKTACVEKQETLGGTCLNVGCIPSKALLQSSEHYFFIKKHAKEHGIDASAEVDFSQMQSRKQTVVDGLVQGIKGLFDRNKVVWIRGEASFADKSTIKVKDKTYTAKNFILATGSEPTPLAGLAFDEKKIVSSTGALALTSVPKKLLVIGAGVIGVELASVYCRLGAAVEIVEMLDRICIGMDKAISKELQRILTRQGIVFHLNTKVDPEKIDADVVLVAVGRRPYTKGLGLDRIGVKQSDRGFVEVDNNYQTTVANIYAIGDIVEGAMLAHRASEEGIAVVDFLGGINSHVNLFAIPNVIYTAPEAAAVGMTEEEAKESGLEIAIGICPMKGNPRARAAGLAEGMVKVIGDKKSGKLIGLHIVCYNASEMIGEGVVALEKGMSLAELAASSHAHPTLSEAIKEAAMVALGRGIHL